MAVDFQGRLESIEMVANSGLDVYAHNVETVEALTPFVRDRRATYRQSLFVLERAKQSKTSLITKSSIMLGCGETDDQVEQTLRGKFLLHTCFTLLFHTCFTLLLHAYLFDSS